MKKKFVLSKLGIWRKALCMLYLLSMGTLVAFAQQRVSGTVTDAAGDPVIGANIVEKGSSTNGTVSDANGNFTLTVQPNATLIVSYIGYSKQEVAVGNRTDLSITLKEDSETLDEVVVVGYGSQKKANLSGAVSTISSKALENRPVVNANYALQGLAPNLNIAQTTGNPTASPGINIRGFTSINGGEAFILVDNVPVGAGELSRINPADIESVSVLRDAASAAIYGARAAFGVVLITTKTAKSSKIEVNAGVNVGVRKFIELPEPLLDTYWAMYFQRITANDMTRFNDASLEYAKRRMADPSLPEVIDPSVGWNPTYTNSGQWDYYANTNWYDVALHDAAATHNHTLRIAQKTDRLSYAVSGGFYQQNSLVKYEDPYKRYNFRGNATYEMTDRWQLGSNITYTRTDYKTPRMTKEDFGQNIFYHMQSKYIFRPVYNPDGSWTQDGGGTAVGLMRDGGQYTQGRNETQLSFNTQIDILKDVWFLKGDVNFRMEDHRGSQTEFPVYHRQGPGMEQAVTWGGSTSNTSRESNYLRNTVINVYTDFHKTFAEKHYVQALVGFNQEDFRGTGFWTSSEALISQAYPSLGLSTGAKGNGEWVNALALRGWFGRLNYIFDNRYIVEFNGRRDASSRFPRHSRWVFFPSVSAAWNVSNEHFLKPIAETLRVNMFKLRASYGSLGNQVYKEGGNEVYYPFYPTMGSGTTYSVLDDTRPTVIYPPGTPAAGNLTWETVRTVNFGLDLALLNNHFDLSLDKYTRYTEGMLAQGRELPAPFGASPPRINAADLETNGWELSVGWRDKFELTGSPFNYSLRFMIADARAEITKYDNPAGSIGSWYVGKEPGEIWGFVNDGFFNTQEDIDNAPDHTTVSAGFNGSKPYLGDLKYADLDGDGKINTGSSTLEDPGDLKIIGNNTIHFPYSFDLNADWKGFDLRAFFQGVGKREFYPTGIVFFGQYADNPWCSPNTKNLDNWGTPENYNPNAYYPKITQSVRIDGRPQTKYLQNAAYLRLKNLTLGYTLPRELTERWKISQLRVFFSGENILTFDHIDVPGTDPETFDTSGQNIHYPPQKVYSFGLNLSF